MLTSPRQIAGPSLLSILVFLSRLERALQSIGQFTPGKRFGQSATESVGEELGKRGFVRIAAANDRGHVRVETAEAFDCSQAAHAAADGGIENYGLKIFATAQSAFVNSDCLKAVRRRRYFVTKSAEKLRSQIANSRFVVHHQNALVVEMEHAFRYRLL